MLAARPEMSLRHALDESGPRGALCTTALHVSTRAEGAHVQREPGLREAARERGKAEPEARESGAARSERSLAAGRRERERDPGGLAQEELAGRAEQSRAERDPGARTLPASAEELDCIDQLKASLREEGRAECWDELPHDDRLNLIRGYWDRAKRVRDMTDAAIEIYDWRKTENIDNILHSRMPLHDEYHDCWPSYIGGEDKYGHWIVLDRVEELEVSALSKYDEATVLQYRAQSLEALVAIRHEISHRLGYRIAQYIYVMDLNGLSIKKHFTAKVRAILQPIFKVSGDFYPDSLWNLFIVNAPMSFRMIWRIISPWIDPVVKAKIRILAGRSAYLPAMTKSDIPLASIPKQLGGESDTISLKEVVERIIDEPDVKDHAFTSNPCPADPAAVAAHRKQREELDRRPSLLGRLSKGRNVKTFRKKSSLFPSDTGVDLSVDVGDEVYNEDEVIMQGWLNKQGNVNTAWRRRYFVLTPTALYYFTSIPTADSHTPRGKIELHMIAEARLHSGEENADDGLIDIHTPHRVYQLRLDAADIDDELDVAAFAQRWVHEITSAAENDICAIDIEAVNDRHNENHISAGFLYKRGAFNRSWRRRYFVLTSHALYYYTDLPTNVGALLKGRIDLYRVTATDVTAKSGTGFFVQMPGRIYYLRADTEELADEWLTTISATVESEQEAVASRGADEEDQGEVPMVRNVDEEAQDTFGRTNSTMIFGLTSLASDFLSVAADMGILRKDSEGEAPDEETMLQDVRKRVLQMFKLF
ncbi:Phosphatidylinositol/phosphatidylcholine transfer protein SFH12 [Hondaea fermentalgiana]|uniref:Phosphatidylinositol/phosphatidylcholine transfer protein SFH12 n=1 Tax=Hondaea fermentalgiana TaxID=2315210 RepID=A0A2R5G612_9STRA|nr:Phosphatidylinositol/phosphatidylcholine transfer protein SFH12 [Hondaea fermentalgiana]|eukprot:GBG26487.1 Phosphatidylinositol/phosphatidylcholine transfer protein SFH12 [Hondaea fermentalgiana]